MTVDEFLEVYEVPRDFVLRVYDDCIDEIIYDGAVSGMPERLFYWNVEQVDCGGDDWRCGVTLHIDGRAAWIEQLRQHERDMCKRYNHIKPAGCRSLCPLTALHMLYRDMSCDDAVQKNPELAEYLLGMR